MHLLDSGLQTRTYGTAAFLDSKSGFKREFMMKMMTMKIVMVMMMVVVSYPDVVTSLLPRAAAAFGRRRL